MITTKNMKSLKESIFDAVEDMASNDTAIIEQFLKDNYEIDGSYNINNDVVDVTGNITVKNKNIESLTNGIFLFGRVGQDFYCPGCKKLTSLKGAPKEVGGGFWCDNCPKLKSLEGAPDKVGTGIYCRECGSIKITDRDWKKYNINL